jgi:triphosphoribosyl-dephospho-CoA synthase
MNHTADNSCPAGLHAAPAFALVGRPLVRRGKLGASQLADAAVEALLAEALLTPKPALVDQRGSGAHHDLNLDRLLRSAHSLHGAFRDMATAATGRVPDQPLREELAAIGRKGESAMFAATGGANAHRGAIWVIGLLVAARAMAGSDLAPHAIARLAGRIACFDDRHAPPQDTHGQRACERYRVPGARGEARAGFPHVIKIGLPALWSARARGAHETHAQLDALLAIMSSLQDTCLLHRGGPPALRAAQSGARAVLAAGGCSSPLGWGALLRLDEQLLALHASPGGCADLLAASLFLDHIGAPRRRSSHAPAEASAWAEVTSWRD